ncbi:hypothetical protein QQ045_021852 [Rhodiola kirilowii]
MPILILNRFNGPKHWAEVGWSGLAALCVVVYRALCIDDGALKFGSDVDMDNDGGGRGGETSRKRKRGRGGKSRKKKRNEDSSHQNASSTPQVKVNNRSVVVVKGNETGKKKAGGESKPSSLLDKMRAKLSGGHFRMLNEKLYTCTGKDALSYFSKDPSLFNVYHTGYQEQMLHWPEQPVNIIMKWLKNKSPSLVVADFGCGDARLSKNVKNKVHSFDLVAKDPSVIACDMSNTPLESSSIDVAVFCLSLMGINYQSFIQEANRVLKPSGWLLIAEVKSRFDPNTGGADPNAFIKAVCELGFTSELKDFSNKMFILLYFKKKDKESSDSKHIQWPELKPCLYKRR